MNIYIKIINSLNGCNSLCCLGIAIVLCTLIVCVTIIIYRLLLICRDLIDEYVMGLSMQVTDPTINRSRYMRNLGIVIILVVLFSLSAIILPIILCKCNITNILSV